MEKFFLFFKKNYIILNNVDVKINILLYLNFIGNWYYFFSVVVKKSFYVWNFEIFKLLYYVILK